MNAQSPKRRITRKMTLGLSVASALVVVAGAAAAPAMAHGGHAPSKGGFTSYGSGFGGGYGNNSYGNFGYDYGAPSKADKTVAVNGLVKGSDNKPLTGVTVLVFKTGGFGADSSAVAATVSGAATTPSATPTPTPSSTSTPSSSSYWPWGLPPTYSPAWTFKQHIDTTFNFTVTLPRGSYLLVYLPASDSGLTPAYKNVTVGQGWFGKSTSVGSVTLEKASTSSPSTSPSASTTASATATPTS